MTTRFFLFIMLIARFSFAIDTQVSNSCKSELTQLSQQDMIGSSFARDTENLERQRFDYDLKTWKLADYEKHAHMPDRMSTFRLQEYIPFREYPKVIQDEFVHIWQKSDLATDHFVENAFIIVVLKDGSVKKFYVTSNQSITIQKEDVDKSLTSAIRDLSQVKWFGFFHTHPQWGRFGLGSGGATLSQADFYALKEAYKFFLNHGADPELHVYAVSKVDDDFVTFHGGAHNGSSL
jgi:hypothetical protein